MRMLGITLGLVALLGTIGASWEKSTSVPRLLAPGYYLAARASYQNSSQIEVRGQTNLPPGSILTVQMFNFVGPGAEALSKRVEIVVKPDQTFLAWLAPETGEKFSFVPPGRSYPHNPICTVTFDPTVPRLPHSTTSAQPAEVLRALGQYGKGFWGEWESNPLVYCGKVICFVQADIPVTD
jgi:hypothetical protein